MKKTIEEVAREYEINKDSGEAYHGFIAGAKWQSETDHKKVKAITDESGHWYIIPNELYDDFWKDLYNNDMCDSGEFDDKYRKYRTGGDLNLIQLYTKSPEK